jgi:hypothetical protein
MMNQTKYANDDTKLRNSVFDILQKVLDSESQEPVQNEESEVKEYVIDILQQRIVKESVRDYVFNRLQQRIDDVTISSHFGSLRNVPHPDIAEEIQKNPLANRFRELQM